MEQTKIAHRRAIFMDIDGTLMAGGEQPTATVIRALKDARAAGHLCFLCTGRSRAYIPQQLLTGGYLDGFVAATGTYVQVGENVIHRQRIPRGALRVTCELLLRMKRTFLVEGEDAVYGADAPYVPFAIRYADDFDTVYADAHLTKLTVDGGVTEEIREALSPWFTFFEMGTYFEGILHGNSKASGMEKALKAVGIPREDSVGMGDSANDISMLEYAGLGIAMGNADEKTKQAADVMTKTCREDGVAWAIRHYILGEG